MTLHPTLACTDDCSNLLHATLTQVTKTKAEPRDCDAEASSFDWKEHDRLETERLFSASSRGSVDSLQQRRNTADASSSENSRENTEVTVDGTAEDMLRKCYKTDDVTSLMERMQFSDPKLDREGAASAQQSGSTAAGASAPSTEASTSEAAAKTSPEKQDKAV